MPPIANKPTTLHEAFDLLSSDRVTWLRADLTGVRLARDRIALRSLDQNSPDSLARELSLGRHAQEQLLQWLGISNPRLPERLHEKTWHRVVEDLVRFDAGLPVSERQLPETAKFYVRDGAVVSVLPDRLEAAPNELLIDAIASAAQNTKLDLADSRIHRFDSNELGFEIAATFGEMQVAPRVGDTVRFGVRVRHSPVGAFNTEVGFYAHRLACLNGMTAPVCLEDDTGRKMRIRRSDGDRLATTLAQVERIGRRAFSAIHTRMQALTQLTEQPVRLKDEIAQLVTVHRFSRHVRSELLDAVRRGEHAGEENRLGLVHLLSWLGTHGPNNPSNRIPASVLQRLQLISGVYSAESVHRCPTCSRILSPSSN